MSANGQAALDRARKLLYELIAAGDDIDRERECAFFYVPAEHAPPVLIEELTFEDYVPRSFIEVQLSADKQLLRIRLKTSLRVLRDLLIVTQPALGLSDARCSLLAGSQAPLPVHIWRLWVLDGFEIDCFETSAEVYANVPTFTREDAEELVAALPYTADPALALEQLDDLHGLIVLLATLREFIDRVRHEHPTHTSVRDAYDELWKHLCGAWLWSKYTDQLLEDQDVVNTADDHESDEQDLHKS